MLTQMSPYLTFLTIQICNAPNHVKHNCNHHLSLRNSVYELFLYNVQANKTIFLNTHILRGINYNVPTLYSLIRVKVEVNWIQLQSAYDA